METRGTGCIDRMLAAAAVAPALPGRETPDTVQRPRQPTRDGCGESYAGRAVAANVHAGGRSVPTPTIVGRDR
jgi:hypothetical protein